MRGCQPEVERPSVRREMFIARAEGVITLGLKDRMYLRFDDQSWTNPGNMLPLEGRPRFGRDPSGARRWNVPSSSSSAPSLTSWPDSKPLAPAAAADVAPVAELPLVELHGLLIHAVTELQTVEHIAANWRRGRGGVVVTPNLDHLRRCGQDLHFTALLQEADIVVADGMPLVWASRLRGTPLPQRVAGSNLIWSLSEAAANEGKSIYLLGGAPGDADAAAVTLRERFGNIKVVGTCCPPPGFENDPGAVNAILCELKSLQPDVVYVALGSPKQEKLIARFKPFFPQTWWLGIGISLSFVCGTVRRAPLWMQRTGLEWMHRLFQEPRRLFKRYIVSGLPFAISLLADSAYHGIPARLGLRPLKTRSRSLRTDRIARPEAEAHRASDANFRSASSGSAESSTSSGRFLQNRADSLMRQADELQTLAAPNGGTLRALVLLGGTVRQSPLSRATDRSVLDLPLDGRGSILSGWIHEANDLAAAAGLERLPVRLTVNPMASEPTSVLPGKGIAASLRIERDASEYRGTGGVLRDVAAGYHDDDYIIVANAAQVLLEPLRDLVAALQGEAADVALIAHDDGTPTGIMLVRCAALRSIAEDGFVDMKEQALPRIAMDFDVKVLYRLRPSGLPLRTLEDYILALRCHHGRETIRRQNADVDVHTAPVDPLAEDWTPAFSLVEPGALVDPTARLHDSVVLAGSTVESGAVLVRSIVCPGGIVRHDKAAVDRFVTLLTDREQRRAKRSNPARNAAVGFGA